MPRGSSSKRERQYEHIKESYEARGQEGRAEEIAARTVNKERAQAGEAKGSRGSASRKSSTGTASRKSTAGTSSRKSSSGSSSVRASASRSSSGTSKPRSAETGGAETAPVPGVFPRGGGGPLAPDARRPRTP